MFLKEEEDWFPWEEQVYSYRFSVVSIVCSIPTIVAL